VNKKGDDKGKEEWVSTIGVMNINGTLERVGLYIDGKSVATIVELEEVIGEKFSIACMRKELAHSGSQEIKSSVPEQ
jgi:hypothetical protein